MTHDDPNWERLARYFANELSPHERKSVEDWASASEANQLLFQRLQHLWAQPGLPSSSSASVWERLVAPRLTDESETVVRPLHSSPWWQRTAKTWRVAAVVAGLLVGAFALYQTSVPQAQVVSTTVGKRSLVTLPDGSRVWLNADSRLEYPKKFAGSLREVRLVGEAFFDVTHNPRQPFVIRLATASIRVLGTSFNVRAYPGEKTVKTTVVTGRVAFVPNASPSSGGPKTALADTLFVTPNRHVVQQVATMAVAEEPVVAQNEAAWKDNRLVFDQTPMAEVARTLERWYGVSVVLEGPELANCPLTATFAGQSLPEVMDLMSRTGRFQYSLIDAKLTIRGQGCGETQSN